MSQDEQEEGLLKAFEAGELISELSEARKVQLLQAAEDAQKKDKRINIRIASRDLEHLQRLALQEGMPYQTLIASILHKYVSGYLQEVSVKDEKKIKPPVWRMRPSRKPF